MHTKSLTRPLTCRPMIAAAPRRPEARISAPSTVTSSQTSKTTQKHDRARENSAHPDPPPQQVVHETGPSNEPRHAMGDPRNPAGPRPAARLRPTIGGSCVVQISRQRRRRLRVTARSCTPVTTREVSTVSADFRPIAYSHVFLRRDGRLKSPRRGPAPSNPPVPAGRNAAHVGGRPPAKLWPRPRGSRRARGGRVIATAMTSERSKNRLFFESKA